MKANFPEKKKYAVCLTFDFDALSVWINAGNKEPQYLSRGEYGARVGVPRLLRLLEKHGIKGTWFIPGHSAETFPDAMKEIHGKGHEVGHHGYLHESPCKLTADEERRVLQKGIEVLEHTVGERPIGYRAPGYDFSSSTVRLLMENGFKYDSSMLSDDFTPYLCRDGDYLEGNGRFHRGKEVGLFEFPVSWSFDDWAHFEYIMEPPYQNAGLRSIEDVLTNYIADLDYLRSNLEWGVCTMTFHPQVMGRGHRQVFLEKLIRHFKSFPDVFFPSLGDIIKYLQP